LFQNWWFFFSFFPFFKGFAAWFALWSPTNYLIFFLSSLFLLSSFSFLSFSLGFVSINIVTQLILNYT
jgi:hypothetical protein